MAERVLIVELGLDASENDILEQMRIMKKAREEDRYDNVVCAIRGFTDDPRELQEIPEVCVYCKHLVDLGFISYLDMSTLLRPNTPELGKHAWGAAEVWLCSEGRFTAFNAFTADTLNELKRVLADANRRADTALGTMLRDEVDFDLAALDELGYGEDAVREDIVAPILRRAGYRPTGSLRMQRSKRLVHPFVMIGSRKHKVNIVPDYTIFEESQPLLVLEAKAPGEPITKSVHVEQTYSYAIHPDVRCEHFALCNGRELAFYHVSEPEPLFMIECKEIRARWDEVQTYLLPQYLKMPKLRQFHADFGLHAERMGITREDEITFIGIELELLAKSNDSLYVADASYSIGGLDCMLTFDFGQDVLDSILEALPNESAVQICGALGRMPYQIDLDAKVQIDCKAHLGPLTQGQYEEFRPMIVTELLRVEFDPSASAKGRDPAAIEAGVPTLQE